MKLLGSKVKELSDPELLQLLNELGIVTGATPSAFSEFNLFQFLQQCVHPNGGALKPVKISRECIARVDDFDAFLLLRKVGKVGDELHRLFREFTSKRGENLDFYAANTVYVFLNKMLLPSKKKSPARYFL